jgi:hypothetical protein
MSASNLFHQQKTKLSLEGLHTMITRKAFWTLLAALAAVSTGMVGAQSTTALSRIGLLGASAQKSLVGSWRETAKFLDGPREGQMGTGLINYNSDGTMIVTEGGSISFDPPPKNPHHPQTGSLFSDDVGSWTQTESNTFVYTTYLLFSDFNGNVVGSLKVRGVYHLDLPSMDGYTGYSFYEIRDKDLNPIRPFPGSTGLVRNVGTRLTVDLTPVPTPTP